MRMLMKLLPSTLLVLSLSACVAPAPIAPPRVDHIRLEVSNMDASVAFYRTLGLRPTPSRRASACSGRRTWTSSFRPRRGVG